MFYSMKYKHLLFGSTWRSKLKLIFIIGFLIGLSLYVSLIFMTAVYFAYTNSPSNAFLYLDWFTKFMLYTSFIPFTILGVLLVLFVDSKSTPNYDDDIKKKLIKLSRLFWILSGLVSVVLAFFTVWFTVMRGTPGVEYIFTNEYSTYYIKLVVPYMGYTTAPLGYYGSSSLSLHMRNVTKSKKKAILGLIILSLIIFGVVTYIYPVTMNIQFSVSILLAIIFGIGTSSFSDDLEPKPNYILSLLSKYEAVLVLIISINIGLLTGNIAILHTLPVSSGEHVIFKITYYSIFGLLGIITCVRLLRKS